MGDSKKNRHVLQVHVGYHSKFYEALSIEAEKTTTAREIVDCICEKLCLTEGSDHYELAEVVGNQGGQDCKERRIGPTECPIALKLLWPKKSDKIGSVHIGYKFCLRRKLHGNIWSLSMTDSNDSQLIRDYFLRFLYQPRNCEYPDLCQLPDLTEQTLLDNLKARFEKNHIYTYVGSILIAVNPFNFYPIYNPKYVQLYQNRRLGDLPPHIFAIADAAYQSMLRKRTNQCIVISGESGSGKTESTNLLLHHLTALSQKGTHGSGVEQTILGAGPVLEAFGNAKTKFNNNSSRFGKFIQVNYKENGAVHGALVQKYLLEKSRIVSQVKSERNYHVFYYLLEGLSIEDKEKLHLTRPQDYFYLNQSKCYTLEGADERFEFSRLTQSMEMVGFSKHKQFLCFSVLSAVLHLGNVQFSKKSTYHSDETVMVKNPEVVTIISKLLNVKEETLTAALTCKKTKAAKGEMLVINYKLPDAIATRDAMAKCLYGVLFDWIVMQVNHALLSKKDTRDHKGNSIGVLDIFGFEDFGDHNNFEQFCINYANERLQYYFNQHVFKYEQEEYQREGIIWRNIDFNDNTECLKLIEDKPDGLLYLLDDQCNFPCGSDETILQKFIYHHNSNQLFEVPPCRGSAFTIKHYAGKVKYQIRDFREKNLDLMRPDIVAVLKVSQMAFVRELVCADPLALFRWHILKAFFKAYFMFSKFRELSKMKRSLSGTLLTKDCVNTSNLVSNQRRTSQNNIVHSKKKKYSSSSSPYHHLQRKNNFEKSIRNFKLLKQLLGPPTTNLNSPGATSAKERPIQVSRAAPRKQTQTVTHQFQISLQQLMDTLSHANPFFVRCIKSNAEKMPNHFDDRLVLQQLRYTGMLETVRIRQSGYSVRLTFDEFIQHYRILLPKGLLSSKMDVQKFLLNMKLPSDMYQIGKTKVFMRESEKLALDERLHEEILRRIINLQRWVRTWICRRRFNEMRSAAVIVQTYFRRFIAQKRLKQLKMIAQYENWAANAIQKHWRAYQTRKWFTNLRKSIVKFQASCRGYLFRTRDMTEIVSECSKARAEAKSQAEALKVQQQKEQQATGKANQNASVSVLIRTTAPGSTPKDSENLNIKGNAQPTPLPHANEITLHKVLTSSNDVNKDMNLIIPVNVISRGSIDDDTNVSPVAGAAPVSMTTATASINSAATSNSGEYNVDVECILDDDDDFENNDNKQGRLSRKRNIPIRKTSFKRKANKSLSDEKLLTSTTILESSNNSESTAALNTSSNDLADNQHRQLTKLSSDSKVLCLSTSSFVSSGYLTNSDSASSIQKLRINETPNTACTTSATNNSQTILPLSSTVSLIPTNVISGQNRVNKQQPQQQQQTTTDEFQSSVGPIQKAKATFRNIMGKSNSETNKRMLKQTMSVKCGNEFNSLNEDNSCLLSSKSLSNSDLGNDMNNIYSPRFSSSQMDIQSQLIPNNVAITKKKHFQISKSKSQDGNFTLLSQHSVHEESNFKSGEICAICENAILIQSNQAQIHYKCSECKQLFHKKCIHLSSDIPCFKEGSSRTSSKVLEAFNPPRPPRNKQKKFKVSDVKTSDLKENQESQSATKDAPKQSVRVKEFTDPLDILITDLDELQLMDKFISKKMREMDEVKWKKTKESMVDVVFKRALKEFKSYLITTYSVSNQDGYVRLTYKDLIHHFEQILLNVCAIEKTYKSFPVTIGINAFRGYMDELRNIHNNKIKDDKVNGYNLKKANKRKQSKKRSRNKKEDDVRNFFEHEFYLSTANIYNVCEVCDSFMWLMEKRFICRRCKLTCHKKCYEKVTFSCGNNNKSSNKVVFGSPLSSLVSEDCRIPLVVEQLITKIELKGLYTEGIYRKSARLASIDELKQMFVSQKPDIDLDHFSVHVLAGCLKLFFREMPEPLMTYELYDDFLWATTVTDQTERIQIIFNHISKLPKQNYDLLERLTFHLARVAQQESANRMNANSLAIVFAPCILRTNKSMQMQDKLNDISKQTICIESIISERMRQISDTLNDIDILDTACHTASSRLSSIRHSKMNLNRDSTAVTRAHSNVDDEEALLKQHLDELFNEKAHLTTILPAFRIASACSDEYILSSNENEENSIVNNNGSSEECLNYPNQENVEKNLQNPPNSKSLTNLNPKMKTSLANVKSTSLEEPLNHLTKNRVSAPQRRKPTKQKTVETSPDSSNDLANMVFTNLNQNFKDTAPENQDSTKSTTASATTLQQGTASTSLTKLDGNKKENPVLL